MKRTQLVSPGTLARMRQEAKAAWEKRDLPRCVEILQRMNRLNPADPNILIQLGRMHGLQYDYESADRCFENAVRLAPPAQKAEALAKAGQQARDFYASDLAERYLKRALQEKDVTPEMFVKLAEFCERRRRLDEGLLLAERALEMEAKCHSAVLVRARILHRQGNLEQTEHALRPLLDLSVNVEVRVRAWYEMGSVLDRLTRYDEAMHAFLQAKALLRSDGAPHLAQRRLVLKHVAQMREQISAETLNKWQQFGSELQPARRLTLLGGHPRSGTTLLEQVLDSHDEIVSAEETDHFTDYAYLRLKRHWPELTPIVNILDSAPKETLISYREDYFRASEKCLGMPLDGRVLIDKNPSLTFSVPALVRFFPEIRFLIALRDPRDVVLSCFMQPLLPVHNVSSAYLSLDTTADDYVALMGTWRKIAPMLPNPHIEVRYEDMVEDLESVARRVLEFLGVQWDESVLGFDEHARNKRVRSPTYADVTQKVFTRARGRWRHYQKFLEPHLPKLEPFVKALGYE